MIEEKEDFKDKLIKILLWKARIADEINNILMFHFEPVERFGNDKKASKETIYSAIMFMKELPQGKTYYASRFRTGAICLVSEEDSKNVIVNEYGRVLDKPLEVSKYMVDNKL